MPVKNPDQKRDAETGLFVKANPEEPETLPEDLKADVLAIRDQIYGVDSKSALLTAYKRNFMRATFWVELLSRTMDVDALSRSTRARRRVKDLQVWIDRQTRLAEKIADLESRLSKR